MPISPPKVSIRFKYKERREDLSCYSSQPVFAKRHTEMNMKKQYSHTCILCQLIQYWLYQEHIQTEKERHIVLYPSALNFGDFSCSICNQLFLNSL